jgi:hypothetical protein
VTVWCFGNCTFHPACGVPFSFVFIQSWLSHSVIPVGPQLSDLLTYILCETCFISLWHDMDYCFMILSYYLFRQKVPIGFILSACPSACIRSVSTGHIFVKLDIGHHCDSLSRKIQIRLKLDKNFGHFMWRPNYVLLLLET